jgi:YHS domain
MLQSIRRLGLLLLVAGLVPSATLAADEVNVTKGATLAGPGLAAHGYDVVAYFDRGRPTHGSDRFAVAHEGATYRFASQANLDAFKANPAKYAPAYGGFCAYGAALGKKFDGDPLLWKIVDGRLFLNLNEDIQKKWSADIAGNVAKADENWRQIEHRPVREL